VNYYLIIDVLLALGITVLAVYAIFSKALFRTIVFFICFGLLVTIAWVRLGAIDVAIAEAAIGAGLTGALLLAAWGRLRHGKGSFKD
jgi:uncharacterized MnhB-related membrane protein